MPAVKEQVLSRVPVVGKLASYAVASAEHEPRPDALDIIDIRRDKVEVNLKDEVAALFNPADGTGARALPTLLLYDAKGLQLFEDITYLDEYYLTNYEIELLKRSSAELARKIPAGAMVIELGSGNLRKVCLLLQAFEDLAKPIDYFALDLSQNELERTLAHVPPFKHVACHGLLGTYDDGKEWLKQQELLRRPKCILHLGSSIGNFNREDGAEFLQDFADLLQAESDYMIVGLDSCGDPDKIYRAYNDSKGITHQFILNGLAHANEIYGEEVFNVDEWTVIGEYVYDDQGGRHQAFVSPVRETTVLGSVVKARERVKIEQSLKYSKIGAEILWKGAGLVEEAAWTRNGEYGLHLLKRAKLPFSRVPSIYAAGPLPSMQDWEALWEAWDIVTRGMLPEQELNEKPIKLRNACVFYLGHIPTFLDIQLTKTTGEPHTEPRGYVSIFERGIDPDVDNPEKCHDHSDIPDEWPPAADIAAYQARVRARLRRVYARGPAAIPRDVARGVWVGFEHELMHIETLLYMMLQSDRTLPPPHAAVPDFDMMAKKAFEARVPNEWFDVPEQTITIGMDDPEDGTDTAGYFGWDNEKPARKETVHSFQAKGRPITNEEYAKYMYDSNISQIPASWSATPPPSPPSGNGNGHGNGHGNGSTTTNGNGNGNGTTNGVNGANGHSRSPSAGGVLSVLPDAFLRDKAVRTVYGLVPLRLALDWPVFASYDELARCASWMGGRIPTFEEARSIYAYVDAQKEVSILSKLANKVPAVNGHLVNDGVEETPPALAPVGGSSPAELFVDLAQAGANVGFKRWHPVPVTHLGGRLAGQAGMGGAWEWTSSPLRRHEGFAPMALYPAYTADFFDGKHNVVLGGSWATHPRIAGRRSFVNWYQRNYPYAWVGARVVRDAQ
ncbi:ADP-ribosylation factor family protein [Purpureocillium lavendulum]|uniref:ADP-ribosylation factor family protein n=1 Tax=Purpureocillium lavendulum TaxID=1247861 RepID=A0AB34G0G9_9HYPO|nr:ADP-ribosylation factor family protein [Purpureocillium lavendulum]